MKTFVNSPYLKMLCGIILLFTSGIDVMESLGDGSIGVHHGVFLFGIVQILKALPEIQEGFRDFDEARDAFYSED